MPIPVSATRMTASSPSHRTVIVTLPPAGVYFTALVSRLSMTWAIRVSSAFTHTGSVSSRTLCCVNVPVDSSTAQPR